MPEIAKSDSYTTDAAITVGVATFLTHLLILFLYSWLILDAVGTYHSHGVMQNSDVLSSSLWSLGSTVIATLIVTMIGRRIKYFPPSWLAVPTAATFLYIFSLALFLFRTAVQNYSPTNPFGRRPPELQAVIWSALLTSSAMSFLAVAVAITVYVQWHHRNDEPEFHIEG